MIRTRTALTLLAATLVASGAQAQTTPTPTPSPATVVTPPPPPGELPEALRAQPGGITAEQAARRAVSSSLAVRAARANVDAAGAARAEAALSMIPQINLSARYTRLSEINQPRLSFGASTCVGQGGALFSQLPTGPGGALQCPAGSMVPPGSGGFSFPVILDNIAIRGTVTIPITDIPLRLARLYQAAGLNEQARRLDEEAARNTAGSEARVAFYELLRARGQHAVAQQGAETAARHREDLLRFVEAGTVARVELLRVEAQLAEAERLVIAAREGVTMAEAQLRQRLHMPGEGPLVLGESLDEAPTPPTNLAGLIDRAWRDRPEIASLERQSGALDANLAAARAGVWPSLAGVFNVDIANPNQRFIPNTADFNTTWDASLQLSWSPTGALVAGQQAARVEHQQAALRASLQQMREGFEMEVRAAYIGAQTAAAAAEAARRQILASEESYRVRRERFLIGSAISSDLTDAETDLLRARFAVVNAAVDLRESLARLRRAVGEREVAE
ncbi:MAG: TolC family protein [Polyangiales bacterium]